MSDDRAAKREVQGGALSDGLHRALNQQMNTGMNTAMEIGERPLRHVVNSFTLVSLDPAFGPLLRRQVVAARFVRALADLAEQDAGS
jgi:hypothetical protein